MNSEKNLILTQSYWTYKDPSNHTPLLVIREEFIQDKR